MRTLCCPVRSPFKSSSLLPGGVVRSFSEAARLSHRNFLLAVSCISRGSFLEYPLLKICSVSLHAKLLIISHDITLYVIRQVLILSADRAVDLQFLPHNRNTPITQHLPRTYTLPSSCVTVPTQRLHCPWADR
jgi:hypothetical protein